MADISEQERARLPPFLSTVEDAHRPGEYVVMLSVFHQLHCLVKTLNSREAVAMLTNFAENDSQYDLHNADASSRTPSG